MGEHDATHDGGRYRADGPTGSDVANDDADEQWIGGPPDRTDPVSANELDAERATAVDPNRTDTAGVLPSHGRRDFVKATAAALGTAGLGTGTLGSANAAPDSLPTAQHMHRGHQDVIFLGIYFEDNSPPGPIEDYHAAMFDPDSTLGYEDLTVQEYFDVVSDGRFSISPGPEGLSGWYQVSQQSGDYHLGDAVNEAIDLAIADGFDITAYDQENDTQIVALPYTGGGGGGVAWVGNTLERQGVRINGFCKAPARASAAEQDINYTSHEYLHLHGLTDLYQDPGTAGMGIMGAGPLVNMIPWSKVNVDLDLTPEPTGWDETTPIHPTDQAGILPPQSVENQFYQVVGEPNGANDDPDFHKYYLLAYNDGTGVDAPTDAGQRGLVVWHHHQSMGVEWGSNNFQFATPDADGSTFRATDALPDASLVGQDVVLDNVSTDYGTLQFNDPPHRSVEAGRTAAYAIEVDAAQPDWLPDLSFREDQRHGDVIYTRDVIDARVSWADPGDDVTLRLIDPNGTEHAVSDDFDVDFTVVRSDPIPESGLDGGWKLVEETSGSGTVDYYRASTDDAHELASTTTIGAASLENGTLEARVSLSYADGSAYDYGSWGAPSASQFEVGIDGGVVDAGIVSVTEVDPATYDLTAEVGRASAGDHDLSVTFLDRKAGVTHRATTGTATVTGSGTTISETPTDTATPTPEGCDAPAAPAWSDGTTPYDVDGDGVYEDLNGNCEFDSDDVVTYFQQIDRDEIQSNPGYYDANGNGNADFDDVVTLFQAL